MHEHNSKTLGWTILLNLAITVAEYIGGIFSGSLALLSDAGHNLSDALSLGLSLFGERISEKKATERHSFGFKRVEIFTALINALALWGVGFYILFEAFKRLRAQQNISLGLMLGVAAIGLVGNLVSIMVLNKDKENNLNMKSAYLHLFYDTISSVAVILSAVIIYFTGWSVLDTIVSIFIALMIFWSGFGIIKKAVHIFMQGVPDDIDSEEVYRSIISIKGVKSAHSIHIWSINSNEVFLSCNICLDKEIMTKNSDNLIKKINTMLEKKFSINHTTIQIENKRICSGNKCCK